jgi:hypothetical protein
VQLFRVPNRESVCVTHEPRDSTARPDVSREANQHDQETSGPS